MKKILFYFHDPGGVNFCLPVIQELLKAGWASLDIFCSGPALQYCRNNGIVAREAKITENSDISSILNFSKPDFLLTGTSRSVKNEISFWKAARKKGVPCACVIDYWMDHTFRFAEGAKYHFPDVVIAPDSLVAADLKAKFQLPLSRIAIGGHPYLESAQHYRPIYDKSVFLSDIRLKGNLPVIAYFSDTISCGSDNKDKELDRTPLYGINEKIALSFLISALGDLYKSKRAFQLIVKHHPNENINNLSSIIKEAEGKGPLTIADNHNSKEIIYHSDAVFSIFGMPLLEAIAMNKPVFSICTRQVQDAVWRRFPFKVPVLKNSSQILEVIRKNFRSGFNRSSAGGTNSIKIKGSAKRIAGLLKKAVG